MIRQVARHRLIRSTHIAALVGRSVDRTIDRPLAQLDYTPRWARVRRSMLSAIAVRVCCARPMGSPLMQPIGAGKFADWVGRAAFLLRSIHERLLDRLKTHGNG
jgi:hypothetical protein